MESQARIDDNEIVRKTSHYFLKRDIMLPTENLEKSEVDKRKWSGTKKFLIMRRLFHWKPDTEPLTPSSDEMSSLSDRLSFKSDGASPKIPFSHSAYFGLSNIGKTARDRGEMFSESTSDSFFISQNPISSTLKTTMATAKVCNGQNHSVALSETKVAYEVNAATVANNIGHKGTAIPEDKNPAVTCGTQLAFETVVSLEIDPTLYPTAIVAPNERDEVEVRNKQCDLANRYRRSLINEITIRSTNDAAGEENCPLTFDRSKIDSKSPDAVVTKETTAFLDSKVISNMQPFLRIGSDDSTSATPKVGLSPKCKVVSNMQPFLRIGSDDSTSATPKVGQPPTKEFSAKGSGHSCSIDQKTCINNETRVSKSPKIFTTGVSVATVIKKFQTYAVNETLSFDDDSEIECEDSPREIVVDEGYKINMRDPSYSEENDGGKIISEVKLLETSPISTGRFQKRLVYLSSVDKLNSSIDKVYSSKFRHTGENCNPSNKNSADSDIPLQLETMSAEGLTDHDIVDAGSFKGIAIEDDRSIIYDLVVTLSDKNEAEVETVESLESANEHREPFETSHDFSFVNQTQDIKEDTVDTGIKVMRSPDKLSLFTRLFGDKGNICCGGVISTDTCYYNNFYDEHESITHGESQITFSGDNFTSEDGDNEDTLVKTIC